MELSFSFKNERFDFSIKELKKKSYSLMGASGTGKSTLLRLISGLEHWPCSEISFDSLVWQNKKIFLKAHARKVGFIFQEPRLFNFLNVEENIRFSNESLSSFEETVNLLGIEHLLRRKPQTLSGGEKQRVSIARAIGAKPKLLLLDEPLSNLDNEGKDLILNDLKGLLLESRIPYIYVSHDSSEVKNMTEGCLRIENGKLIEE